MLSRGVEQNNRLHGLPICQIESVKALDRVLHKKTSELVSWTFMAFDGMSWPMHL